MADPDPQREEAIKKLKKAFKKGDPQQIANRIRALADHHDDVAQEKAHKGQFGWRIGDYTGSIPLDAHNAKNVPAALDDLEKALGEIHIDV